MPQSQHPDEKAENEESSAQVVETLDVLTEEELKSVAGGPTISSTGSA